MAADNLVMGIRVHDPKEKNDPKKSTSWVSFDVERADLSMKTDEFIAKYIKPKLRELSNLPLDAT